MKISAIVPVYNTERYVGRCIDSVIAQTYTDWELILVDDGSTDRSSEILDNYQNKDSRIKVIHQENSGPGLARNIGIENIHGDYTVFIDSDDIIKKDYFYKLSLETADVVFIDINQVDEDFNVLRNECMSGYQSLSKDDFIRNQMTGKILWGGVRKAAKTELLLKNKIRFTNNKVGEEAVYSFLLMYYAKSFSFIKGPVYNYVNRVGSQSDTMDDDPLGLVVENLKKKVEQMNLYETYANTINAFQVTATIVSLDRMSGNYDFARYKVKARERMEQYKRNSDRRFSTDFKHMSWKAKFLFPFIITSWVTPIYIVSNLRRAMRK